jgi:hypothetical protein
VFAVTGSTGSGTAFKSTLVAESAQHRVGRVLSFFLVVGIGTPVTPHPQASVASPLVPAFRAEGHTRWREKEWESTNSGEGTFSVVLCKYMYFVVRREAAFEIFYKPVAVLSMT